MLPDPLRSLVAGYAWAPATDGQSGAAVHRLEASGRPTLYLKHGAGRAGDEIVAELARLDWLSGRLPVPGVRHFVRTPEHAYLLTEAVAGQHAYACLVEHPERGAEIVAELVRFLRIVHALPLADCPFHAGHTLRMADARRNMAAGRVDTDDFDEERKGWTAEQVWAEMEAQLPLAFDRVVTHGDFTLDNVLLADGRVTGCIDVGHAGAADPYQDLATLWNTLAEFGGELQQAAFRAYGIAEPDARKLQFHLCLGELF
jgi:aminoglycoside 3'-phosphotransferase-1